MAHPRELAQVRPLPAVAPTPDATAERNAAAERNATLAEIATRVGDDLDALLPRMGDAYRREVAEYAAMPPEAFAHVLETSRAFVAGFLEALLTGQDPAIPDRAGLSAAGRRRQEVGVSLDAAMHAFRLCSRTGWTGIADAANDVAPTMVSDIAARWMEYVDHGATAFAQGHTNASSEQLRRVDARRQALVADLLAAEDEAGARAVGARHGLRLAEWYVPVVVSTSEPFAAQDRVRPMVPPGSLVGHRDERLMVLVPLGSGDGRLPSLAALVAEGVVAHGRPARLGAPLVAEVARAESILGTAVDLGRLGFHGPDALVLERVVREHDGLRASLVTQVLEPLAAADGEGIFRETLDAFLDSGTIRSVADDLFVHANTVTYRLRRVRELTGLDARVPRQAARLVLALALQATDVHGPSVDGEVVEGSVKSEEIS